MAATVATLHGKVLIQIGDGEPVEVGTVDIPIRVGTVPEPALRAQAREGAVSSPSPQGRPTSRMAGFLSPRESGS